MKKLGYLLFLVPCIKQYLMLLFVIEGAKHTPVLFIVQYLNL